MLQGCTDVSPWLGSALSSVQGQVESGTAKTTDIFQPHTWHLETLFAWHSTGHELHAKQMSLQDSSCAKFESFRKCCREGPV